MLDAIGDTAYWSTSAEVIAGLVVAVVFTDVARTEQRREQIRWFGTLRIVALVAIAGGLGACLVALADEDARTTAAATLAFVSVLTLGGLVGIRPRAALRSRPPQRRRPAAPVTSARRGLRPAPATLRAFKNRRP